MQSSSRGGVILNPKYQRHADRIRDLIEEGDEVTHVLGQPAQFVAYSVKRSRINSWLVKVHNILQTLFGSEGVHTIHFLQATQRGFSRIDKDFELLGVNGVLTCALDDLENGYLVGQEFLVAGEVFDSILDQAKHLNQSGYKDPAAVLARVVLEDALKRIARDEGLEDRQKASVLNNRLWKEGRYSKPQWRLNQVCLDIGNAAAHGEFDTYDEKKVERCIEDTELFLEMELSVA